MVIFQYLNNNVSSRTFSSPNIRQSCTSDSAPTALPTKPRGFPSTPNVGTPSDNLPMHNVNSITNIFPKNISNLSKKDNNDVTSTPSVDSEHKVYQKDNVWMKRRSSPVSVLELGRTNYYHERNRLIGGTSSNPHLFSNILSDSREPDSTVFLNVGGKRFEVLWHTLGQFPGSRLSRLHDCATSTAMLEICDR